MKLNSKQRKALKWIGGEDIEYVSPFGIQWCIDNELATQKPNDEVVLTPLGEKVLKKLSE